MVSDSIPSLYLNADALIYLSRLFTYKLGILHKKTILHNLNYLLLEKVELDGIATIKKEPVALQECRQKLKLEY